jgi:hypothetical protein
MTQRHLTSNIFFSIGIEQRRWSLEFNLFDRIKCKIQKPIQQIIAVTMHHPTSPVDLVMHKLNDE